MNTSATTYIGYAEPTLLRSNEAQAYSQCMPEPNYEYSPEAQHGSYYSESAPMPQQPTPVQAQAPVAKSSSAGKVMLFVAGLAVVGAAAFAGVMLLNSSGSQATPTTTSSSAPADAAAVNLPKIEVQPPAPSQNAAPVVVNYPAPVVRVNSPSAARQAAIPAQKQLAAQASAPALASAPAQASAPEASVPDSTPNQGSPNGVSIQTPVAGVSVGGQNGVSVDTPIAGVGVPGQNGGDVKVVVGGQGTGGTKTGTTTTNGTTKGD